MSRSRHAAWVVVALLVFATVAPSVVATPSTPVDSGVLETTVAGPGNASVEDGTQFVWAGERIDIETRIGDYVDASESYYEDYYVRVTAEPDARFDPDREESLASERVTLGELDARDLTLAIPADALADGPQTVYVSMYEPATRVAHRVNHTEVSLHVITKDGDLDRDALPNAREVAWGTALRDSDSDDDGLADGHEADVFGTNPLAADSDGDGVPDPNEVRTDANPGVADTDADGVADDHEVGNRSVVDAADSDLDGLSDPREQQAGTDPTARDTDGDGLADGTEYYDTRSDPLVADTDDDGLTDSAEINRFDTDPTAVDSDGDGIPDGQEVLRGTDPATDTTETSPSTDGVAPNSSTASPATNPGASTDRGTAVTVPAVGWLASGNLPGALVRVMVALGVVA